MKQHARSFDFILNTIPQPHDINPYMELLKRDGTLTIVGCVAPLSKPLDMSKILIDRKSVGSSLIGGIAETQETLDFCAQHNITANIQIIDIGDLNDAFAKINKGEVDFRYVIDMATLDNKKADDSLIDQIKDAIA